MDTSEKKAYYRDYYQRTKEAKAEYGRVYREANKEKRAARMREYYIENKERRNAASAEYYASNREARRLHQSEYASRNIERKAVTNRKYVEKETAMHAKDPTKRMLRAALFRAEKKGLDFNIDASDIVVPSHCPVLGVPLSTASGKASANSPSLDRIDSSLGYVKGNVQVISYKANAMKSNATPEELLSFANWCTNSFGLYSKRSGKTGI